MASCAATSSRSSGPISGSESSSCASQRSRSSPESSRTESNPAEILPHCSVVHCATSFTVGQRAVGCPQMMLQGHRKAEQRDSRLARWPAMAGLFRWHDSLLAAILCSCADSGCRIKACFATARREGRKTEHVNSLLASARGRIFHTYQGHCRCTSPERWDVVI
jgi:hypothetical protein